MWHASDEDCEWVAATSLGVVGEPHGSYSLGLRKAATNRLSEEQVEL